MNVKSLVPNALTMGNLLGGAYVCWVAASGADLFSGVVAGVWGAAMICDVLDGWAARKLGVDGPLGVQLDSLADLVTGGMAPAFVAYRLICEGGACDSLLMDVLPWPLLVAAAYRLARYNVGAAEGGGDGYFEGLPAPASGMFWMGMMMWWGVAESDLEIRVMLIVAGLGLLLLPIMMVMKRRVFSLKNWGINERLDRIRIGFFTASAVMSAGVFFAWHNVYAAVPLCVLLYSCFALAVAPKQK
jgi:CDP-diacylglycerol--serine O-phosphatidyltransferase